jgi:hypothetical protein
VGTRDERESKRQAGLRVNGVSESVAAPVRLGGEDMRPEGIVVR